MHTLFCDLLPYPVHMALLKKDPHHNHKNGKQKMSVQSKEARDSFTKPQPPRSRKLLHSGYGQICRYLCLSLSAPAPPCAAHSPALSSSLPGTPSLSPLSSSCPNLHLPHCHPLSPAPGCSSKARSRTATPPQNTLRSRPGCQKSLLHHKAPPAPIEMRDRNSSQLLEVLLSPPSHLLN